MAFEPNKVTWYSKALAMAVFVAFPFIAFWLGVRYAELKFAAALPIVPSEGAQLVGGDTDEHGCIGSAGYSWCDATKKCVRPWEESCYFTADGCVASGGDIVTGMPSVCPSGQEYLGEVMGVRCPCICCK